MNMMNQPRPELQDKIPIDNHAILSYDDVLKDLNATSAVVYEELNDQSTETPPQQLVAQQPAQQPLQHYQQQSIQSPPHHVQQQQQQQQQQPQQPQQPHVQQQQLSSYQEYPQEYPQEYISDDPQMRTRHSNTNMYDEYSQPLMKPRHHVHSSNERNNPTETLFDKNNINDIALIIIAFVVVNNRNVINILSKQFPSLFVDTTPNTFGTIFQGFLLVLLWILSKKLISQYMYKV
jgi:hypothetical protein